MGSESTNLRFRNFCVLHTMCLISAFNVEQDLQDSCSEDREQEAQSDVERTTETQKREANSV
jgi:hypothetical protein